MKNLIIIIIGILALTLTTSCEKEEKTNPELPVYINYTLQVRSFAESKRIMDSVNGIDITPIENCDGWYNVKALKDKDHMIILSFDNTTYVDINLIHNITRDTLFHYDYVLLGGGTRMKSVTIHFKAE